ncbi:hypothetical protein [Salinibacterium sp. M195]|uniref:hypothetical protein n=1 Tax=Salinibacterium sp. M195 TaxID=2583374 RepID=UPI001C626D7F|nr:hypothetical protein [Salinibacterium sp. M195]QYH34584.1 hypothetical protein FFT87_00665 [Salinibacterium sp. M195]
MPNSNWTLTYDDQTYSVTHVEAQKILAVKMSILEGSQSPQPYAFYPAGQGFDRSVEVTINLGDDKPFDLKPEALYWKGYDA